MKQAFKTAYERELAMLKERGAIFAEEHPGLADRLGGLLEENLDPSIAGLLEGAAFLAARVQLNIDQQFRTFSSELLEQLCPDMTAPLPSAVMVQGTAPGKAEDLVNGRRLEAEDALEAMFSEGTRRVACRFRLAEPLTFWPVKLSTAELYASATPLSALGCDEAGHEGDDRTEGGLVLTLASTAKGGMGALKADELPIYFTGAIREAKALYEQVFADTLRITLRWEDKLGTAVFRRLPVNAIRQVGFDERYPLFGRDQRVFPGISTLLEYFAFPRKFLGLRLVDLQQHLRGIEAKQVQVIVEFKRANTDLATQFKAKDLRLFCAPAVNLFEEEARPVTLVDTQHRFQIGPNRTPTKNYEVHRILSVRAQYDGVNDKVEVHPLYAAQANTESARQSLYYTFERQQRRLTMQEIRRGGVRHRYEGTETWLTYYEPPEEAKAALLFSTILCSNRHLTEILPIAEGTFHLLEDRLVRFRCVTAHSEPRESLAELESEGPHRVQVGDNYWRLISLLSLSYRGLTGPGGKGNVAALRETLRLFSDISDQLNEAHILALTEFDVAPITRTIKRQDGFHPARGLEVRLTFDDEKIDTATTILLGAVLDRYLADYAAINSFTECVLKNRKGRILKRFAPRSGSGPLL